MTPEEQKKELKEAINQKIEELTFANYEGSLDACLIVIIDKGSFRLLPAYGGQHNALMNLALDLAKDELLNTVKLSSIKGN